MLTSLQLNVQSCTIDTDFWIACEGFTIQSSIYKDTLVSEYSATTSIDREIVNIGDNVVFKTADEDYEFY